MNETLPEALSRQPTLERIKERLRQERETFEQHRVHENRWFLLRLVLGYSTVPALVGIMVVSSYILLNSATFSGTVVTAASAAFFVDTLGLLGSIWKVVFKPDFTTKLAPTTQVEQSDLSYFEVQQIPSTNHNDIIIFFAQYGINESWIDVAPLLRAKVENGKLRAMVTNEEFGGWNIDPARGVPKKLQITYAYLGTTHSKTVPEKQVLLIPEP